MTGMETEIAPLVRKISRDALAPEDVIKDGLDLGFLESLKDRQILLVPPLAGIHKPERIPDTSAKHERGDAFGGRQSEDLLDDAGQTRVSRVPPGLSEPVL
jgi:hypothetical protein